jgi:hypothetical protein
LPLRLFENIEAQRTLNAHGQNAWLRYASYHLLYAIRLLADSKGLSLDLANVDRLWKFYPKAKSMIRVARKAAKKRERDEFEDVLYFKSGAAKADITNVVTAFPSRRSRAQR